MAHLPVAARRIVVAGAGILLAVGALGQQTQSWDGAWTPLFDGATLAGFTQRGGQASYRVEDGAIVGTTVPNTPNTFLCTDATYADFELELEFKVHPKLNSGVQIRSNSFPTYKGGVVFGYQVEIDPSERRFSGGIYDEARLGKWIQDLSGNQPARDAFRPDAWNHLRVVARGESMRTWINGVPAADVTDAMTHAGFIGLQVHSTDSTEPLEVRWRNLRIRDLGDPWAAAPKDAVILLGEKVGTTQWEHADRPGSRVQWSLGEGPPPFLEVRPGSGNIVTKRSFGDVRLHVEFCVDDNGKEGQANGNSGVYIQRRYEIQILNSWQTPPADDTCGGIYKVAAAAFNAARPPGQWQSYDIWFRAARFAADGTKTANARVTVYHNGTRIHDDVEIPDKTGGGQPEGPDEGPLLLQDHGNRVRFRNIWAAPLPAR